MKKALDQTVRDLKREVNKKVLKVSSIEQKTLDATSNEPCGPPGSYLAEIARATYNFHDYQLIMTVVWRRIQSTGKNWRHVYKALNVLDYLIIYGPERVIDEIREHAYQISALSGFLYIDSNGKDQGSNVRSKSQSLVALVNNKGRLLEVRHKALFNRNKNHNISGSGESGPPLSSSTHYNDEHFEGLDDNREEGHLQERDMAFRDKVSSSNEGDDHTPHRVDAPPSYEEAVNGSWSHNQIEKDKDTKAASVQKASLTSLSIQPSSSDTIDALDAGESVNAHEKNVHSFDEHDYRMTLSATSTAPSRDTELDIFGVSAVDFTASTEPTLETSTYTSEDNFANYSLGANFVVTPTICAVPSQPDANPFGDAPFKATPPSKEPAPGVVGEFSLAPPVFYASEYPAAHLGEDILDGLLPWTGTFDPVSFQETLPGAPSLNPFEPPAVLNHLAEQSNPFTCPFPSEINSLEKSELTDPQISQGDPVFPHTFQCVNPNIIQPSAPVSAQASQPTTSDKQGAPSLKNMHAYSAPPHANIPSIAPANYPGYQMNQQIKVSSPPPSQEVTVSAKVFQESAQSDGIQPPPFQATHSAAPANSHGTQSNPTQASHIEVVPNQQSAHQLNHSKPPLISAPLSSDPSNAHPSNAHSSLPHDFFNRLTSEKRDEFDPRLQRLSSPAAPQNTPFSIQGFTPQPSLVPSQASKKDFQPKSAVWADTISRGLVNLDLSASKANSLVHIGVDFDDINRKERRNDARSAHTMMTPASAMGKAMGAGSGLGRAGSSPFALPLNTPMGSNMGMAGPAIRGAYNPMNAGGCYGQQQPYGGEGGGDR